MKYSNTGCRLWWTDCKATHTVPAQQIYMMMAEGVSVSRIAQSHQMVCPVWRKVRNFFFLPIWVWYFSQCKQSIHVDWLPFLNILVCASYYLEASYPGFDFMNGTSGTILLNWKNQLGNSDQLTSWAGPSGPCGSNPWFHTLCAGSNVQRMWGLFATLFFSSWQQYASAFPNLSKYLVKLKFGCQVRLHQIRQSL
jgi:hypothetical protein